VRDKIAEVVDSIRKEPHPAFLKHELILSRTFDVGSAIYPNEEELENIASTIQLRGLRAQLSARETD